MSSLEPPIPGAVSSSALYRHRSTAPSTTPIPFQFAKYRRAVGLGLLAATVFLWTASNFLASTIFADNTYDKPFLVTYVNTAFFIVPLIPILISKAVRDPDELKIWGREVAEGVLEGLRRKGRRSAGYGALPQDDDVEAERGNKGAGRGMDASQELLLGEPLSVQASRTSQTSHPSTSSRLSLAETTRLSLEFSALWFLANYFVAACLSYTTVASSTILTSTSSVFTLLFGALFGVETFTLRKLLGILASLAGISLISTLDLRGANNDPDHRGDFPVKSPSELAIGDGMAFLSAVLYGLYAVFMKKRIGDESRVHMPLFFGLVGLINVTCLWPAFFLLHYTGIETFALPPTSRVAVIVLGNSMASLVSDLAWAYAVLLTSPIVVTVGLSCTIPLSLVGELVLNGQTTGWVYWVGAGVVVMSFLFVNHEEKKDELEEGAVVAVGDGEDGAAPDESAR